MDVKTKVLEQLLLIPSGKVTTYGTLAKVCNIKSARYIGRIMATNERPDKYPCYKVVGSDGSLVGYSGDGGLDEKISKLKYDGVVFKDNGKVNLIESLYTFDNSEL